MKFPNAMMAPWRTLKYRYEARRNIPLRQMFIDDRDRFRKLSLAMDDLLLDYSKTRLNSEMVVLLADIALATEVAEHRNAMYAGRAINQSQRLPALHVALRANRNDEHVGGCQLADVVGVREEMLDFVDGCIRGGETTADGGAFSDVVNIGIGGSALGPEMATTALSPFHQGLRARFAANVDPASLADALAGLDARRTLVIVSSKTFTTAETLANAAVARDWLAAGAGKEAATRHLVGVTAAADKAREFGCGRIFQYANWVGGRYSVWGAVGLPLALAIGRKHFLAFLAGARDMDLHFSDAPLIRNMPIMLGMIGVWHRNMCRYPTRAIFPYADRLRLLPAYLRQLDMESNGKSVSRDGKAAAMATAPIVWGDVGANAQHASFQLLHQGTDIAPCEFILFANGLEAEKTRQRQLFANGLAQAAALMSGDESAEDPRRRTAGNRPSITLMQDKLTPYALGRLLALYEHRAFVEGAVWDINSFDQWGVELGKAIARRVDKALAEGGATSDMDGSTRGLMTHWRRLTTESDERPQ